MNKFLFFLTLAVFSLIGCTETRTPDVFYEVSKKSENGVSQLKVRLECNAEDGVSTSFSFQNKAWGQDSLHNVITSMRLIETEGVIEKDGDKGFIVVHPKDTERIQLEYTIQQDFEGVITTKNDFRPIIQPSYFHVYSHSLFMFPDAIQPTEEDRFDAEITWLNFSEEETIINSFGANKRVQTSLTVH